MNIGSVHLVLKLPKNILAQYDLNGNIVVKPQQRVEWGYHIYIILANGDQAFVNYSSCGMYEYSVDISEFPKVLDKIKEICKSTKTALLSKDSIEWDGVLHLAKMKFLVFPNEEIIIDDPSKQATVDDDMPF